MNVPFVLTRRVAFSDTDAAGIAHFTAIQRYMEEAEHALFRTVGYPLSGTIGGKRYLWPRVRTDVEYQGPLGWDDACSVTTTLDRLGNKSLSWRFEVRTEAGDAVALGHFKTVCCLPSMETVRIPDVLRDALAPHVSGQD